MSKSVRKKQPVAKRGWVVRSTHDGKLTAQTPTKTEAVARARFLAVASLNAVPKKSKLTQAQAKKIVSKIFEAQSVPANET
ncbi:MAG TPA: hypothetical protein PKD99_13205 [Sphingopyxis sp.]|nr:hypothetical protein [Sphingopyxis sp.]HMP46053.1 hypothetical protein [Sphingopyxis sp.]